MKSAGISSFDRRGTMLQAMTLYGALLLLHVSANLAWIGSILAVAVALTGSHSAPAAARAIYRKVCVPAFIASLVGGVGLIALSPALYFVQTRWMHGKLTLVLVIIALHHVIGARAKGLERGSRKDPGSVGLQSAVLLACAVGAAFLALQKPF